LRNAILSGVLDARAVEASLERIDNLRARAKRGTPDVALGRGSREDHVALVRDAARRAIAIVRASPGQLPLPLSSGTRVFIVNFKEGAEKHASTARVQSPIGAALAGAGCRVTEQLRGLDPAGHEYKQLLMAAGSADVLIAVTRRAYHHPLQAQAVQDLALFGKLLAVVAALDPFDAAVLPESAAVIASFGDGQAQLEAAADVLLGRSSPNGHVPVPLPGAAGVVSP